MDFFTLALAKSMNQIDGGGDNSGTSYSSEYPIWKEEVIDLTNKFVSGGLDVNNGANISLSSRLRLCYYLNIQDCVSPCFLEFPQGLKYNVFEFDEREGTEGYIRNLGWDTSGVVKLKNNHKYRIVVGKADDSAITTSDVAQFVLHKYMMPLSHYEKSYNLFSVSYWPTDTKGLTLTKNEDETITINGTATDDLLIILMGGASVATSNVSPTISYISYIDLVSGTQETTAPYFVYRDSYHSSDATMVPYRIHSFGSSPRILLKIDSGASFTDACYRFFIAQTNQVLPYVEPNTVIFKDPFARGAIRTRFAKSSRPFNFFTVKTPNIYPFGKNTLVTGENEIDCALALPSTYTSYGKPTRLVLTSHGQGIYIKAANNYWGGASWKNFISALTNAGYACFDANLYQTTDDNSLTVGENYGSPIFIHNLKKAYNYILENFNVYPEIFVHGTSMGGVGATGFTNTYPQICLAESSFAGRDFTLYLWRILNEFTDAKKLMFANLEGYETFNDLMADKLSHIVGYYPSLSLVKVENGVLQLPPDRETDFNNWIQYYAQLQSFGKDDDPGDWIGIRKVPYKGWNSWADRVGDTKLELILEKAYNTGSSCVYHNVIYDNYDHNQLCWNNVDNMHQQLFDWYHQFE